MTDTPFQHVIVLVLENRSFDQMLGSVSKKSDDYDKRIKEVFQKMKKEVPPNFPIKARYITKYDPDHEVENMRNLQTNPSKWFEDYKNKVLTAEKKIIQVSFSRFTKGRKSCRRKFRKNFKNSFIW